MKGIKKLSSGQWQADLRKAGFPRLRRNFRTKAIAESWKAQTLAAMNAGAYISEAEQRAQQVQEDARLTLRELSQRYLDEVSVHKTPRSIELETSVMRMLSGMDFIDFPADKITQAHIEKFYQYMRITRKNKATSANRKLTTVIHMFNKGAVWLHELKGRTNPALGIKEGLGAGGGRRRRTFRGSEENDFLHALKGCQNPYIAQIFILARETGMRRREILENLWVNVYLGDMPYIHIHAEIAKTRVPRDCPLTPAAVDAIATLKELSGGRGALIPITEKAFIEAWKKTQKRSGVVNFQFRDLRHVALTRLSKIYPRAQDLARISGHDKLDTLLIYYEGTIQDQCVQMQEFYSK
ncbi:tyrosine-type recombinase/integrase [Mariprofundus ferrooxydans]|nr:tyrosine-type recombinase/integrase [Mariprofundus ferrooxydans]